MIFIIDTKKEAIAVAESVRMKIPIVAILDTNCNPEGITLPIPGNDDAIRAINLFCRLIADAVIEGQSEAGKMEISEEGEIMSLEDEERAKKEQEEVTEEISEEEGYVAAESEDVLSDNEVQGEIPSGATADDQAGSTEQTPPEEENKAVSSATAEEPSQEAQEAAEEEPGEREEQKEST
jgi:small subunit ribosomal protein S2